MITFGKNTWHRRIVTWGMGRRYLEHRKWDETGKQLGWEDNTHINLCPYMRALLAVFLISPWIAFWKILPDYCTFDHADESKIFLIIGSICAIIHVIATQLGAEWWHVPVWVLGMTIVVSAIIGTIFGLMTLGDWIKDRPRKTRKPSIVREYMKAKHDKVCPCIEFSDD